MDVSGGIGASLPGRYAVALFELAREGNTIDTVESSLARVRAALDQSPDFAELTTSPLVEREQAKAAVAAVAQALDLDQTTANFLGVLADNRRLAQLGPAIRAFTTIAAQHRGETSAEVTSAHPLTDDQTDALKARLRSIAGREVKVDLKVDPTILGGLVVRMGSQMIDGSLRTKLNSLATAMKG
ncbi:MAG: F0F1 ATP synthase subunit delta [Sphingomonadaceae bacterium]|nr:F0F1 ATP synthase subunit delta [Sphingomonadaceae bacterium]